MSEGLGLSGLADGIELYQLKLKVVYSGSGLVRIRNMTNS